MTRPEDREFCAFVAARSGALLRTAYVLTGSHAGAEDLLQSSLLKVYLSWSKIRDHGAVEAYARTVMVRTHASFWRRTSNRELSVAELPDAAVGRHGQAGGFGAFGGSGGFGALGADAGSRIEERDELWRALAELGPRQRAVVVLRFYEDLTEAEIAAALNCSVGTVKSQLSRALDRLRRAVPTPAGTSATPSTTAEEGR